MNNGLWPELAIFPSTLSQLLESGPYNNDLIFYITVSKHLKSVIIKSSSELWRTTSPVKKIGEFCETGLTNPAVLPLESVVYPSY